MAVCISPEKRRNPSSTVGRVAETSLDRVYSDVVQKGWGKLNQWRGTNGMIVIKSYRREAWQGPLQTPYPINQKHKAPFSQEQYRATFLFTRGKYNTGMLEC